MVSIVIPALNEEQELPATLAHIRELVGDYELILVDGGSEDRTVAIAAEHNCQILHSPRKNRAYQMNLGARHANGEWLLFLHADTWLPPESVAKIEGCTALGGAFRRTFRKQSLLLRCSELMAFLRNRTLVHHLGDQAIFARREVFESINGFRLLPHCEDLDFSLRFAGLGKPATFDLKVRSSARRFENGLARRLLQDSLLAARHVLFDRYSMPHPPTVLFFLKAPRAGFVKTRLAADLGDEKACEIYRELATRSLSKVPPHWPIRVHFAPDEAEEEMRAWLGNRPTYLPQPEGDLGARLQTACDQAFEEKASGVILLGGDCPDISEAHFAACERNLVKNQATIGPARDGGYWLLALPVAQPSLFMYIDWSTSAVLSQTLARFEDLSQFPTQLETLEDIDDLASWHRHTTKKVE